MSHAYKRAKHGKLEQLDSTGEAELLHLTATGPKMTSG